MKPVNFHYAALASAIALVVGVGAGLTACSSGGTPNPAVATALNTAVADGQLFCGYANGSIGQGVVAVTNALSGGKALLVTGMAQSWVAAACPVINSIKTFPVSPPANPAAVPAVAVVPPTV